MKDTSSFAFASDMSRFAICSISSSGPCCARMSPWLTYSGLRARRHLCRAGSCVLLPLRSAANPRGNRRRRGRGGMPWARRPSTCPASPGALPCPREAKRCGGRSRRLRPRGSRGGRLRVGGAPSPAMLVAVCDGGPSEGRRLQRLDARRLLVVHDEGAVV